MLTLAVEEQMDARELISAIPERIRALLVNLPMDKLMEIRLRCGMAVALVCTDGVYYLHKKGHINQNHENAVTIAPSDIRRGMELITRSSVYAFENEIKNGYITLAGGHRVGIVGDAVLAGGKLSHLRTVQSLNYRFAREIIGVADPVMDRIFDGKSIKNTLIVSPPMCGKTTMLRDIARQLSLSGKKVSIVDERGEIAALVNGVPSFSLGANCDVLSGVRKADGMLLMLRAMSPDVIITDEIGDKDDFDAICEIKKRGVSIITSLHGKDNVPAGFDVVIRLEGVGVCSD